MIFLLNMDNINYKWLTILFAVLLCLYVVVNVVHYGVGGQPSDVILTSQENNAPPPVAVAHQTPAKNNQDPPSTTDALPILRYSPQVRRYLTIKGNGGRLGNQMYAYASLLGIANATYMRPIENADGTHVSLLTNAFRLSSDVITRNKTLLRRKYKVLKERGNSIFTPEFMAPHRNDTMLVGYLQSHKYFDHIASRLRRDLTFKEHIMNPAKSWVSELLANHTHGEQTPTLIGLHVRRGLPSINGYKTPGVTYFEHAMAHYKIKYPSALFVATNSATDWMDKYLLPRRNDVVKTKKANSAPLDMAILSLCNHTLMSVGTYGWWSAWLAGGDVVYYTDIAVPGSRAWKEYRAQDYFPEHWLGME